MARKSLKVAVIGAGVSGLVTTRELQREGQHVVVYEKSEQIGGTWVYNPTVEDDDLLGINPDREIVHSSLYYSLRTNLPPQLMEFTDYPFNVNGGIINRCNKQVYFPRHQEVLEFLKNFVRHFELDKFIRFNTEVVRVEKKNDDDDDHHQWVVQTKTNGKMDSEELFDAVVVCNGHNTKPRLAADVPAGNFATYSHNYRVPEPFRDQIVVVIGAGPSAYDIAFEISKVAKEVHLSTRLPQAHEVRKFETYDNVWQHLKIQYCNENGEVCFEDGELIDADIILQCTGFNYDFPFLKTNGIVTVDDNRVGPLYKHVFSPQFAPTLSFVGIPKQTINFLMMELQAKWVANVLCGKVTLPSKEDMLADIKKHYKLMEETRVPKHHTHTLPLGYDTYIYLDWLAAQVGVPPADEEQKLLFKRLVEHLLKKKNKKRLVELVNIL